MLSAFSSGGTVSCLIERGQEIFSFLMLLMFPPCPLEVEKFPCYN